MELTGFRQVTNAGHGFVIESGEMGKRIENHGLGSWPDEGNGFS